MTPRQAFAILFKEQRDPPSGDALDALYAINLDREAKRERPAIPHWWGESLPRKPR